MLMSAARRSSSSASTRASRRSAASHCTCGRSRARCTSSTPSPRTGWCDPVTVTAPTRMRTEIDEQPEALARTLNSLIAARTELRGLRARVDRVVFFARGSSDNAAVYGRYLCEIVAGVPAALGAPSVATLYGGSMDLRRTLAVFVSQSGRTHEMV